MQVNTELRDFLRTRREALTPPDVGLPWNADGRRVKGLRRAEVAALAGVSPDYYARLEQGRARQVSIQVLHAIADALQLATLERRYLMTIAHGPDAEEPGPRAQAPRAHLQQVLDSMTFAPALIRDSAFNVIASNRMWRLIFNDLASQRRPQQNVARWTLLQPAARSLYLDWERVAREVVRTLRVTAATHPHDPEIAKLLGELAMQFPPFADWWSEFRLFERSTGVKRICHPIVGEIDLQYDAFGVSSDSMLTMVAYSVPAGSQGDEKLRMLASWADEPRPTIRT